MSIISRKSISRKNISRKKGAPKKRKPPASQRTWSIGVSYFGCLLFYFFIPISFLTLQMVFRIRYKPGSLHQRSMKALVWVIAALGLNIVVGYAGLLDLGFVAFWASALNEALVWVIAALGLTSLLVMLDCSTLAL
ncbi:MAG: hypothetical protein WDN07_04445 [Actinomycetota bacterium]